MTSELEHCLAILKALQIAEVSYCLSGSGNSGTVELDHVLYADGCCGPMPAVTIGITDAGSTISLDERLETIVYDLPDGDWINNEGGHGSVVLRPQEEHPEGQVECDMTYGEDCGEPDFEDEDEAFPASDFNDADPVDEPIAIDDSALRGPKDSALQPATGGGQ